MLRRKSYFVIFLLIILAAVRSYPLTTNTYLGATAGDMAGRLISPAGDLNRDGLSDFVIGAPFANTSRGTVYIIYGSPDISQTNSLSTISSRIVGAVSETLFSQQPPSQIGQQLSHGDLDGDGYSDILIGAPYVSSMYVLYGQYENFNLVVNTNSNFLLYAPENPDDPYNSPGDKKLGASLSGTGDLDGDGNNDCLVGLPGWNPNPSVYLQNTGGAWMIRNAATRDAYAFAEFRFPGIQSGEHAGECVDILGDINGDGFDDAIIGAPYNAGSTGGAYIIYGRRNWPIFPIMELSESNIFLRGESSNSHFGGKVASAGDFNKDGFGDFLIMAPKTKKIYLFKGGPNLVSTNATAADYIFFSQSNTNVTLTTASLRCLGDINGDGLSDFGIGFPTFNNKGRVYIIPGKSSWPTHEIDLDTSPDIIRLDGGTDSEEWGKEVCSAGDIEQDGIDEFLIASPGYQQSAGKVTQLKLNYKMMPMQITSLTILDQNNQIPLVATNNKILRVRVVAPDPDVTTKNIVLVNGWSDFRTGSQRFHLYETEKNSGIFETEVRVVNTRYHAFPNQVAASVGNLIQFSAVADQSVTKSLPVINGRPLLSNLSITQVNDSNLTNLVFTFTVTDPEYDTCHFASTDFQYAINEINPDSWINVDNSQFTNTFTTSPTGITHSITIPASSINQHIQLRLKISDYFGASDNWYMPPLYFVDRIAPPTPRLDTPNASSAQYLTLTGSLPLQDLDPGTKVFAIIDNQLSTRNAVVDSMGNFSLYPVPIPFENSTFAIIAIDPNNNRSATSNTVNISSNDLNLTISTENFTLNIRAPKLTLNTDKALTLNIISSANLASIYGSAPYKRQYRYGFLISSALPLSLQQPATYTLSIPETMIPTYSYEIYYKWPATPSGNWVSTTINNLFVRGSQISFQTQQTPPFVLMEKTDKIKPRIVNLRINGTPINTGMLISPSINIFLQAEDDIRITNYKLTLIQRVNTTNVSRIEKEQNNLTDASILVLLNYMLTPEANYFLRVYLKDDSDNVVNYDSNIFGSNENILILNALHAPNPFNPDKTELTIGYNISRPADITMYIIDLTGTLVREWHFSHPLSGYYQATWDGKNMLNQGVYNGIYYCYIIANGSQEKVVKKLKFAVLR